MAVTDGIFSSKAELNSSLQASQFGTNIKPLSSSEAAWLEFVGKDRYGNDTGWGRFLTMFNSLDVGIGPYFDNARGTAYDDVMKSKNDDVTKAHELADTEGYRLAHHQKQWSKKIQGGIAFAKVFSMASGAAAGGAAGAAGAGAGAVGGGDAVAGAMSEGGLAEGTMPLTTMAGKSGGLGSSTALEGVKLSTGSNAITDFAGNPQFALDPSKSTLGTLGGQTAGMFDYKPTEEEKLIADKKQTVVDQLKKYSNNAEAVESFGNIFKVGGGIANVNTTGNTSAAAEAYNKEMANLASHEGDLDVMDSIPIVNIFAGFSKSVYDINASRDAQEAKVKYYLQSLPRSMNLDESQFIG